ncbi:putative Tetraspanin family protein [Quillaja saponaria]|uniref:Tetraspanin family protein n=1 Tax=Quillaja saponaria TaxID=32244 RepID=A0AAD7Q912_QUISA|nr:putative Tetraspanin family protein [Quillaja saponaria]
MRPNCCHISLAFVLKFLNFLQAFVGVSILLYSVWMLNQWNHHIPITPPSARSPGVSLSIPMNSQPAWVSGQIFPLDVAVDMDSGLDKGVGFDLHSLKLPAPWFIYSFMGVGILLCCITFLGCIAAEAINGCCLCFYTILITILIVLEAALVAFIAIDRHWEKDLPFDPTGDLDSLRSFIEDNIDTCKWVGIAVITIQALSLLMGIILRALVSTRKSDFDCEDDLDGRGRTWEPLLNPQTGQPSGSTKGDSRGAHSDIWSSRIREKYGLNSGDKNNLPNQNV